MVEHLELTRKTIMSGQLEKFLAEVERQGLLTRSSREYRDQTRAEVISQFDISEDIWLFAYGSLLWNPTIRYKEIRQGTLYGFRRRFCLKTILGRGTPTCPGLMLALDYGGSCKGIVYRISRDISDNELKIIWDREMVSYSYIAKVVRLQTDMGPLKAITFAINRNGDKYFGALSDEDTADLIAFSDGPLGKGSDYLFETIGKLAEYGITDSHLNKLELIILSIPHLIYSFLYTIPLEEKHPPNHPFFYASENAIAIHSFHHIPLKHLL